MKREILDNVDAALSRFDDESEVIELAPHETSLDFLRKVYRSVKQRMSRRMRAAIEALQHEHPRLGAITTTNMSGKDFATLLERAILRSNKEREAKQIEGSVIVTKPACQNLVPLRRRNFVQIKTTINSTSARSSAIFSSGFIFASPDA